MSTVAEVRLWGKTIGAVSLLDGEDVASFEYDAEFAQSGIEIAPVTMPLSRRVYRFPALSHPTFHGLPGPGGETGASTFATICRQISR